MNKILFTSDFQLGWKLFNITELYDDLIETFNRVVDVAIEHKVSALVICGDLFDTTKPTEELVYVVSEGAKRLKQVGIRAIGLAGDHDMPNADGTTWIKDVCGFDDQLPQIACFDFNNDPEVVMKQIATYANKEAVEFLCFHGMVPEMYPFIDEKKRLDFLKMDYKPYPNLKFLVGGDLHNAKALEFQSNNGHKVRIEYCGSPAVIKTDEIPHKQGLLLFDGQKMIRIPFPILRPFVEIDFRDSTKSTFNISDYDGKFQASKKPVFIVKVDETTKNSREYFKLYDIGFVRLLKVRSDDRGHEEIVNIRSELGNEDRVVECLKQECLDQNIYDLVYDILHQEDCKAVLDQHKQKYIQ